MASLNKRRAQVASAWKASGQSNLARQLSVCSSGECLRCGDACVVKARKWRQQSEAALLRLLSRAKLYHVRYTREDWVRYRRELRIAGYTPEEKAARQVDGRSSGPTLAAIEKSLRRAFDKLDAPVVAFGFFDAWYGADKNWQLGFTVLVAGLNKTQLIDAFSLGPRCIQPVRDLNKAVRRLVSTAYTAKVSPFDGNATLPSARTREYYRWLSGLRPGDRIIRYGCDRYFNELAKKPRKATTVVAAKRRPYPQHLVPFMFGNHSSNCNCISCGGLGKNVT